MYAYVKTYVHMCICIYTHIDIYICIDIYINIYIYIRRNEKLTVKSSFFLPVGSRLEAFAALDCGHRLGPRGSAKIGLAISELSKSVP